MTQDAIHWTDDAGYGFAIGRMRSLEQNLLDYVRYERLACTADRAEFLGALGETVYAGRIERAGGDWEALLADAQNEHRVFFLTYCREAWLAELLDLPDETERRRKAARAEAASDGTADPAKADAYIEREEQTRAIKLAAGHDFMAGFLRLHADLTNIRTAVRVAVAGEPAGSFEQAFLPGGTLAADLPVRAAVEDPTLFCQQIGQYRPLFEDASSHYRGHRSLARLEQLCRVAELHHWRRARYCAFGYEPLLAFYFLRENELTNLRLLHAAKTAGMPDDDCRGLIAYVG